jgi:1,4-dihydroxy-2-naphthoyl-CoA synthase
MGEIITERSGSILRVELNRPAKKNAMTSSMYVTLAGAFNDAAKERARARRALAWRGGFVLRGHQQNSKIRNGRVAKDRRNTSGHRAPAVKGERHD